MTLSIFIILSTLCMENIYKIDFYSDLVKCEKFVEFVGQNVAFSLYLF